MYKSPSKSHSKSPSKLHSKSLSKSPSKSHKSVAQTTGYKQLLDDDQDIPSGIPLPFVQIGTTNDLGIKPIDYTVMSYFNDKDISPNTFLNDRNDDIETYIYGQSVDKSNIDNLKIKWVEFQNEKLVPAINRILQASGFSTRPPVLSDQLSGPVRDFNPNMNPKLTHLEFCATNLYTKEHTAIPAIPLQFYSAVSRYILQMSNPKKSCVINEHQYDDDKKIFNIWLYLFLMGLHKLIGPVKAHHSTSGHSRKTVRLYRGINVPADKSKSLWKNPTVESAVKGGKAEINVYTTLGFSSFTTDLAVSCEWFSSGSPNFLIYEPKGKNNNLPSLKEVSDIPKEDEYITFPLTSFMVNSVEPNPNGAVQHVPRSAKYTEACVSNIPAIWIGLIDVIELPDVNVNTTYLGIPELPKTAGPKSRNKLPEIQTTTTFSGGSRRKNKKTQRKSQRKSQKSRRSQKSRK